MSFIPMQILEYRFNDEGLTQQIIIAFQHYQGNEQINVRIALDQEYVDSQNPTLKLDSLNKDTIENFARRKIRDWILAARPVDPEEPEVEE